ncbi:MAG: DUF4249 family protein [Bacteroidetes bacterium]|jgi:hypothetical protein|nr:DUF4249 family protein [Bacteroidota bacterium]
MEIRRYFWGLCLAGLLCAIWAGCKKDNTTSASLPVVEAYLYAGHPIKVKLYQQKSLTDTAKYGAAITGQQLLISDGSQQIQLTESPKGTYTYIDSSYLVAGRTYTLTFNYQSRQVSAKTVMPFKPTNFATQHDSVHYTHVNTPSATADTLNKFIWDNADSLNHVLVFDNIDDSFFPLDGGFVPNGVSNIFSVNTERKPVYYIVNKSFPYYGHYQVVLLRVNQEYIDLLKSNALGSNSQNLLNIPTNVINGLGIFTAMQSDTLKFYLYE